MSCVWDVLFSQREQTHTHSSHTDPSFNSPSLLCPGWTLHDRQIREKERMKDVSSFVTLRVFISERGTAVDGEDRNRRDEGERGETQWRGSGRGGGWQEDENTARRRRDDVKKRRVMISSEEKDVVRSEGGYVFIWYKICTLMKTQLSDVFTFKENQRGRQINDTFFLYRKACPNLWIHSCLHQNNVIFKPINHPVDCYWHWGCGMYSSS